MEPTQTMPHARVTPKDFFLWLGAMVSLYWCVVAFIFLFFNYIDHAFPNVLSLQPDPYQGGMPYEMASLVVLFPLYFVLLTIIRRGIAADSSRREIWIRRWVLILTLFVTGATIVGDVITLLTAFFRGEELTTAFLLKAALVLVVAAGGFVYIWADLKGYWDKERMRARVFGITMLVLVAVSVAAGFVIVGTPYQARQMRLDTQRVTDLQSIQWQVVNYWQAKQTLPPALAALNDSISGYFVPVDPETGSTYEYSIKGSMSFELCATFTRADSNPTTNYMTQPVAEPAGKGGISTDSWAHAAGHVCFARTIDPERYPPLTKTVR